MHKREQQRGKRQAPRVLRLTCWSSAVALAVVVASAVRIHGDFEFVGTLADAQRLQFAAMWLLAQNGLVYVLYRVFSRQFVLARINKASPAQAGLAGYVPQAAFRA